MKTLHAEYISSVVDKEMRKVTIQKAIDCLREHRKKFDVIVFTGLSGALIGPVVADALDCQFIAVRKDGDGSHSGFRCEGIPVEDNFRYIIIDDIIATGHTFRQIISALDESRQCKGMLAGIYLYSASQICNRSSIEYDFQAPIWGEYPNF